MAKKKISDPSKRKSILDIVKSFDENAEIIENSVYSNIEYWISSGNYILNAAMSGDIFKAVPSGRVTTLYGPSSTGKTYLACSICREAQKMGITPIYLDSEGAIDANFVKRLGVDPSNFIVKQVSTISETSSFIANICQNLKEQEEELGDHDRVLIVLDSLGNLTSDKEKDDILSGNQKRDMTKAQEIKALFRVNATPLARLQIPMIVVNHSYACLGKGIKVQMSDFSCAYKDISEIKKGDYVKTLEGNKEVTKVFSYKVPYYHHIVLEDGTEIDATCNHSFLVKGENGVQDFCRVDNIKEGDEICCNFNSHEIEL